MMKPLLCTLLLATLASPCALAQGDRQPPGVPRRADIERMVHDAPEQARVVADQARAFADYQRELAEASVNADFDLDYSSLAFIGSELGSLREIVKNAPYTADAVTESVQTLQDGNRIVRRTVTRLARDTYGRTRQEKTTGGRSTVAYVFDPIDHRSYALNLARRTAVRIPRVPDVPMPDTGATTAPAPVSGPHGEGEKKSLGTRDFDGVKADGTQVTHTIPAGAIGNEKPIAIVSERWFSPELQLVVMARTSDPRSGVTTYRLTNLKRGEPPADLFKVPSDYRVGERRGG
jgi:hypothetical protein